MVNRREFAGSLTGLGAAMVWQPLSAGLRSGYEDTGVMINDTRPAREGFYFPAEWALHERTLMQFLPRQSWNRSYIEGARKEWAAVANIIAGFEPVTMVVRPEDKSTARALLSGSVELLEMPLDEGWARDSGPIVLVNTAGERRVAGFEFNGWGRKMWPCKQDALLKARLAGHYGFALHPSSLVLEGGAITVDGDGTCITTEECLLNQNRNPGLSKDEVEEGLKGWLGVREVIWLANGIVPDPVTDGHVDGIAAFVAPGVVALHTTYVQSDPNYAITQDAKRRLTGRRDAKGRMLQVIEMPLAVDVAHMNFYICNGAVIVPVANDPSQDDAPLAIIREAFPKHEVLPVGGLYIAEGGGGVHCITQQVPAV
jgi:agmatine deiminase